MKIIALLAVVALLPFLYALAVIWAVHEQSKNEPLDD